VTEATTTTSNKTHSSEVATTNEERDKTESLRPWKWAAKFCDSGNFNYEIGDLEKLAVQTRDLGNEQELSKLMNNDDDEMVNDMMNDQQEDEMDRNTEGHEQSLDGCRR
jgi:hypothetical protein